MKRREFLRNGSLLIPAFLGGLSTGLPMKLFAESTDRDAFSLSIITNQSTTAIHKIEQALRFSEFNKLNINFSEHQLIGEHISDIAFVKNNSLINYFTKNDKFSNNLKKIAHSFSFPNKVTNPTLLVFSAGNNNKPEYFNVSVGNKLLKRIPVNSKNGIYKIEGINGQVELEINAKSARIHSSSCKHKTCVGMGEIKKSGENLVCIPNRISISVSGNLKSNIDSVTF